MDTAETYTIEDYNTLKKAIAQGALRVRYGDKEVEYRSLNDMQRILGMMAEELGLKKRGTFRKVAYIQKSR